MKTYQWCAVSLILKLKNNTITRDMFLYETCSETHELEQIYSYNNNCCKSQLGNRKKTKTQINAQKLCFFFFLLIIKVIKTLCMYAYGVCLFYSSVICFSAFNPETCKTSANSNFITHMKFDQDVVLVGANTHSHACYFANHLRLEELLEVCRNPHLQEFCVCALSIMFKKYRLQVRTHTFLNNIISHFRQYYLQKCSRIIFCLHALETCRHNCYNRTFT